MNAIRLALVLLLMLGVYAMAQPTTSPTTAPASAGTVNHLLRPAPGPGAKAVVIGFEGTVDEYNQAELEKRIAQAKAADAQVIILQINSYGGLVTAGLDIARTIKRQDIHVVAFIDEKAYSAGSMMAVACDEIVMEPSSILGDCGVIRGDGQAIEGDTERAKAESPVMAEFMASADRNGYSKDLLAAFVQSPREVHFLKHNTTGEKRFFNAESIKLIDRTQWSSVDGVPDPLDGSDTIFTTGNDLAAKIGLSQGTFSTAEDFAASRGWTIVANLQPTDGEKFIGFLSSSTVRSALVSLLVLALVFQVKLPFTGVTETAVCVILALLLVVPLMTGYAQWYEVAAVLMGIVLIAVEVFVIPGFGVAGIAGIVLLLGGLLMTFLPPIVTPTLPAFTGFSTTGLRTALTSLVGGMVGGLALWAIVGRYGPDMPIFNRLVLKTTSGSQATIAPGVPSTAVAFPTLNSTGTALTDLRPGGTARFTDDQGTDQNVDVVSDRGFVSAGTPLTVVEVHGTHVVVRPA
ncbi:MAG: ATP-dependent Clp protease proteolytic subunit [Tepidisphaeraceae bacterium]